MKAVDVISEQIMAMNIIDEFLSCRKSRAEITIMKMMVENEDTINDTMNIMIILLASLVIVKNDTTKIKTLLIVFII
jgi:hypothetical protein